MAANDSNVVALERRDQNTGLVPTLLYLLEEAKADRLTYFSGHGLRPDGKLFIVATDLPGDELSDFLKVAGAETLAHDIHQTHLKERLRSA